MNITWGVLRGSPRPLETGFSAVAEWERAGDATLVPGARDAANSPSLRIAIVVPWLGEIARGHETTLNLATQLEARGHEVSVWLHDPAGPSAEVEAIATVRKWVSGMRGTLGTGFDGADVVVATSWQIVYRVLTLDGCRARAYLVLDHEADFYPDSAERRWADRTYRLGLHCITAGRALRDLVAHNYGATASWFEPGIDQSVYSPRPLPRADDVVLAYSDVGAPQHADPLVLLALAAVKRRRPDVRLELFGDRHPGPWFLEARDLGMPDRNGLAEAYSRAAVGVVLSLTSYPLIAQEMLACGLPCVEAGTPNVRAAFGPHDTVSLAPLTVEGVAEEVVRLLDDPARRAHRSRHGIEHVSSRTWEAAGESFEGGLREALRLADE